MITKENQASFPTRWEVKWKRKFAFFTTPVQKKGNEITSVLFGFYEEKTYWEAGCLFWETRLVGADRSFVREIKLIQNI